MSIAATISRQRQFSGFKLCLTQANAALTGTLPASLPAALRTHNYGAFPTISVVYLSNNSISGTLPSEWGKPVTGWGPTLERLYLDNNRLTGKLPQLWSDSNTLWSLERVDLFNNQLTGPVDWDARHLPKLENVVLSPGECAEFHLLYPLFSHHPAAMPHSRSLGDMLNTSFAGNDFCGNVPRALEGVVRRIVRVQDGQQLQLKVTHFLKPCPGYMLGSTAMSVVTGKFAHSMFMSLTTTCVQRSGEAHVSIESFRKFQVWCTVYFSTNH